MKDNRVNNLIIGIGVLLLASTFFYKKKPIEKKVLKTIKKPIYDLPIKFINDVNKMSDEELDKAISENIKYLENSKMLQQTREAIEKMLKHLQEKRGK